MEQQHRYHMLAPAEPTTNKSSTIRNTTTNQAREKEMPPPDHSNRSYSPTFSSDPSSYSISSPPSAHHLPPPPYTSYSTSSTSILPLRTEAPKPTASSPPGSRDNSLPPLSEALYPDNGCHLPPINSVTGGRLPPHIRNSGEMTATATNFPAAMHSPGQWPSVFPPATSHPHQPTSAPSTQTQQPAIDSPGVMDVDTRSSSTLSVASPDSRLEGRAGSVNLDDPDVRLAAEALGDLRADFVSSPSHRSATLPLTPPAPTAQPSTRSQSPQGPEPLLSLLTTSHPLLATTITGATSAYGGAKNFSPRFKSSAEYVEGYLTPLANTVGSVGRVTGVEGGVRWFLGAGRRQRSDAEAGSSSKKRRKVEAEGEPLSRKRLEAEGFVSPPPGSFPSTPKDSRRMSFASTVDTLPAYDDLKSPAYTETDDPNQPSGSEARPNPAWQSRLIMSTSGLSVAMSDESLRSLKYCLQWLKWANVHIGGVAGNLKTTLEQYDQPPQAEASQSGDSEKSPEEASSDAPPVEHTAESRAELANRIDSLKGDVLKTLQDSINMVSRYTGGALPENARILVRRHLTSLPQRFRVAAMSENNGQPGDKDGDAKIRDNAHRVLLLAKEGLDMVSQVSGVLDGTIASAEEWCERMGKKKSENEEPQEAPPAPPVETEPNGDVKMN